MRGVERVMEDPDPGKEHRMLVTRKPRETVLWPPPLDLFSSFLFRSPSRSTSSSKLDLLHGFANHLRRGYIITPTSPWSHLTSTSSFNSVGAVSSSIPPSTTGVVPANLGSWWLWQNFDSDLLLLPSSRVRLHVSVVGLVLTWYCINYRKQWRSLRKTVRFVIVIIAERRWKLMEVKKGSGTAMNSG